ncbi:hypothetical protein [Streptomyces sp. 2A115]|uniref:hypothetical protein n=1 Tax=Streptomyces sp. 2A115 TaxID=3457439 RepID=UPI003FD3BF38
MSQTDRVLHVLIDPLVPAEDTALITSVPPALLPPSEGPVPDRPRQAGRPPQSSRPLPLSVLRTR